MNDTDPRVTLRSRQITKFQIYIIAICVLIAALDGFDVLVAAYTAPAIAKDWNLTPTSLGALLSAGLVGMGFGAVGIAPLGDRIGRKTTILLCLIILCAGMLFSASSSDLTALAAWRTFTGLGIGGALANINIMVVEYSPNHRRGVAVSLMTIGYPIGATLGGFVAVYLIDSFGWRSVYVFGGLMALLLLPPSFLQLPESIDFLVARRPRTGLVRLNKILRHLNIEPLERLPDSNGSEISAHVGPFAIFGHSYRASTIAASTAYFLVMLTVYFLLSWMPRIVTQLGLSISSSITVSLLVNVGGVVGCLAYGVFAVWIGFRRLAAILMVGLFLTAALFGVLPPIVTALMIAALAIGFFLHSSVCALYTVVPGAFPAAIRTTGTGFAMGMGRVGAAMGPYLAGFLMAEGWSRPALFVCLSLPMLLAAVSIFQIGDFATPRRTVPTGSVAPSEATSAIVQ
ncbi:MAG TPA: MFS transporter [Bradyrhizobium sp.]|nr:MFS transporter [Bradyrhizobium sp.]